MDRLPGLLRGFPGVRQVSAATVGADVGFELVTRLAVDIGEAAPWLSELDGTSGDGDHGVNMRTGMELAAGRVQPGASVSDALKTLGNTLLEDVGGAMGPLYGSLFLAMSSAVAGLDAIDAEAVKRMLTDGTDAVVDLGGARVGDKTLVDVLVPSTAAFEAAIGSGQELGEAFAATSRAAEQSRDATKDLVARIGRAARAGERSVGHIDAGAASCAIVITAICAVFGEHVSRESVAG